LATARIIEMIAGERRTPVGKNADELAIGDKTLHVCFRKIGKAKTLKCSFQEKARAVEYELSLDANVKGPPVLFELPRVQAAAVGRQA
jgi:hypothetical protein